MSSNVFISANGNMFLIVDRPTTDTLGVGLAVANQARPVFWLYLIHPADVVGVFESEAQARNYAAKRPNLYEGGAPIE